MLDNADTQSQTDKAEEMMDNAMDEMLKYNDDDDENEFDQEADSDDDSDNDEFEKHLQKSLENAKRSADPSTKEGKRIKQEPSQPPSFSKIPPCKLREKDNSTEFPLLKNATRMEFTLEKGDILYLPTGWFHEVQSTSCTDSEPYHLALNYWYAPPSINENGSLYPDDYWKETLIDPIREILQNRDQ